MDIAYTNITCSYDAALKQPVVTVCDAASGELIRQIPPEPLRRFAASMLQTLSKRLDAWA